MLSDSCNLDEIVCKFGPICYIRLYRYTCKLNLQKKSEATTLMAPNSINRHDNCILYKPKEC